ncbi:MAG: FAD-dependent oxidoreductase [Nevskia sp.]|nr:FAD-dependent oxidoreductase [Nevskia sp.]
MRIAVVGAGVAGLVCAYALRNTHDVVLFEKEPEPGGHAHTVDVELGGFRYAIDTGFIVYNDRTYPQFGRLIERLGVRRRPTRMSFGVSCADSGIEYSSEGLTGLFAQPRNLLRPQHHRMLLDILRFNRESRRLLGAPCGLSLGEYLQTNRYSQAFVRRYLLPMCAAIWSGSLAVAGEFPVDHFVEFFSNHGLLSVFDQPQWYVIEGGSREYVRRLAQTLGPRLRAGVPVRAVQRTEAGVLVRGVGDEERFDRVIFACHSDQALALLADPTDREREILGDLPYQANDVVLHHDARLLPRNRRAWASWNYRLTGDPQRPATVTYHMNRLQGLSAPVEFCITLNRSEEIAPEKILGRYCYAHPVYTKASSRARARRAEIDGQRNTHYCGAYWENGFHEDGVRSALAVARSLGGSL